MNIFQIGLIFAFGVGADADLISGHFEKTISRGDFLRNLFGASQKHHAEKERQRVREEERRPGESLIE